MRRVCAACWALLLAGFFGGPFLSATARGQWVGGMASHKESSLFAGLVGYYSFEGSGPFVPMAGSSTQSFASNGGAGVGVGAGKIGQGITVDGTVNSDYHLVPITGSTAWNNDSARAMTIAYWIKMSTASSYSFWKDSSTSATWFIRTDVGGYTSQLRDSVPANHNASVGGVTVTDWVFLVAWYDPADQKNYLQLNNGTPVASTALSAVYFSGIRPTDIRLLVSVNGSMDCFGYWGRLLTTSEKTGLYAAGTGYEVPWPTIFAFYEPVPWRLRSLDERQRIVFARTGVLVPAVMFSKL